MSPLEFWRLRRFRQAGRLENPSRDRGTDSSASFPTGTPLAAIRRSPIIATAYGSRRERSELTNGNVVSIGAARRIPG